MSVPEGKVFVQHAVDICESLGYSVFQPHSAAQPDWDILVNGMKVQVKKRSVDSSKPNNIRLVTAKGSGAHVYRSANIDAFAVHWRSAWYVFPSSVLRAGNGWIRNGIYMPSLSGFINKWDVLAGIAVVYAQQKCFDF